MRVQVCIQDLSYTKQSCLVGTEVKNTDLLNFSFKNNLIYETDTIKNIDKCIALPKK